MSGSAVATTASVVLSILTMVATDEYYMLILSFWFVSVMVFCLCLSIEGRNK